MDNASPQSASLATPPPHVPADRVFDIDVYAPPGFQRGFHDAWSSLHAPGVPDLVWTPRNGGHWIVARGKLIAEVYGNFKQFSNHAMLVPKLTGADGRDARHIIPSYVDPPEHRPYRAVLNSSFAPKTILSMEETIRRLAIDLIEKVAADGHCNFMSAYAETLPIQVFMSLVDLPLSDVARVKSWVEKVIRPDRSHGIEQTHQNIRDAHRNIYDYLEPYVVSRVGGDGVDMFTRIVNGRLGDRALTKSEMMDMCTQVMFGGLDTVVNFLGFALLFLATSPTHRRALVAEPALIPSAVDELVRRFPVVTVGREIRDDIQLDGVSLKKGEMIMAPTPLAGTDDRLNENPLEVDFHRAPREHTTFGNGRHRCPGELLARTEIRITLTEWLARIPEFSLAPDTQITYHGGVVGGVEALPLIWNV